MSRTVYCDGQMLEPKEAAGWGGFEAFYDRVVAEAPPGSTLVEVGVFCGKSLIHLAKTAKAANKGLKVYGVDSFKGSPEFSSLVFYDGKPITECHPATIIAECVGNLVNHGVRDDVTLIVSDSAAAADLFYSRSVFMVFIDAAHDRDSVVRDIAAWSHKIERGGYLAGDDIYIFPGVKDAVDACFDGDYVIDPGRCWWERKYDQG